MPSSIWFNYRKSGFQTVLEFSKRESIRTTREFTGFEKIFYEVIPDRFVMDRGIPDLEYRRILCD